MRYTAVTATAEHVVETARTVVRRLVSAGWVVREAEHSYVEGNPYKGLHLLMRSGDLICEIQVHSRASMNVKTVAHEAYEKARDRATPRTQAARLHTQMTRLWAQVPTPPDIGELKTLGGVPVLTKAYPNPYKASQKGDNP